MKRYVLMLAVMALLMVALTVPAFAGERALDSTNSICAASGQNDDPDEAFPNNGRVQSYGQYVKKGAAAPGDEPGRATPGFACNGHIYPYPPGPPPPPE